MRNKGLFFKKKKFGQHKVLFLCKGAFGMRIKMGVKTSWNKFMSKKMHMDLFLENFTPIFIPISNTPLDKGLFLCKDLFSMRVKKETENFIKLIYKIFHLFFTSYQTHLFFFFGSE